MADSQTSITIKLEPQVEAAILGLSDKLDTLIELLQPAKLQVVATEQIKDALLNARSEIGAFKASLGPQ